MVPTAAEAGSLRKPDTLKSARLERYLHYEVWAARTQEGSKEVVVRLADHCDVVRPGWETFDDTDRLYRGTAFGSETLSIRTLITNGDSLLHSRPSRHRQ